MFSRIYIYITQILIYLKIKKNKNGYKKWDILYLFQGRMWGEMEVLAVVEFYFVFLSIPLLSLSCLDFHILFFQTPWIKKEPNLHKNSCLKKTTHFLSRFKLFLYLKSFVGLNWIFGWDSDSINMHFLGFPCIIWGGVVG